MKALIYMKAPLLKPVGGPIGYCYNLFSKLKELGVENVHFIGSSKGDVSAFNQKVKNIKIGWLRTFVTIAKSFYKKTKLLYGFSHKAVVDLNQYDVVHFQGTMDMFACRDSLKKYRGKVVLTSHSPTVMWKEVFDMLTPWEKKYFRWYYKKLERMDIYSFNRADYIVFPCEEAEEPYYNSWELYREIHDRKKQNYRYLLSGINDIVVKEDRSTIRARYEIPEDAFVISYVGRHNEIKGYDLLKQIGEIVLKNDNVWFLVAGREGPLFRYSHSRWVEIGWTTDPHSLIAASDMFILPNRETYFDLVMLELLAVGQIVLTSHTGGNKYFDSLKPNGILVYDTVDEAVEKIKMVMEMTAEQKMTLRRLNRSLYENNFTSMVFAQNYVKLINSL